MRCVFERPNCLKMQLRPRLRFGPRWGSTELYSRAPTQIWGKGRRKWHERKRNEKRKRTEWMAKGRSL